MTRISLVAMIAAAGLIVAQGPAAAHSPDACAKMSMGGLKVLRLGNVRQIGNHNHNHDIRWSTGYPGCGENFPVGGKLRVRVRFIERTASGDCTDPPIKKGDDTEVVIFTGPGQTKTIATNVLGNTCYRFIWRPETNNLVGKTINGAVIWPDS